LLAKSSEEVSATTQSEQIEKIKPAQTPPAPGGGATLVLSAVFTILLIAIRPTGHQDQGHRPRRRPADRRPDGDADRLALIIFVNQTTTSTITHGKPRIEQHPGRDS